jgi:t-SNARE syntaxin family protein
VLIPPSDVLSSLNTSRPLFSSYLRIRSSASSANSPELVEARNELESTLKDLTADLADLVDSVKAVESDPYAFGLDISEVQRRRKLVDDAGDEVERMRQELRKTLQQAQASKGKATSNDDVLADPDVFDDDYATFELQRQEQLMQEQDEQLDTVFRTVGNIREQADYMGRELEEQGQMLEEVDTIADRVGGKLQTGLKKMGKVIRQNEDSWSSCCIAVLIFVLILLLFLLLVI